MTIVHAQGLSSFEPELEMREGALTRSFRVRTTPFLVGRSQTADLILQQPYVSRRHAAILASSGEFVLQDQGSRHGTFVNRQRVTRHGLRAGDVLQFGSIEGPELRYLGNPHERDDPGTTAHGLLGTLQAMQADTSELGKLRWFLQAARNLNDAGAADRILASLLAATLALARVERGFIFLPGEHGELRLAQGMDAAGNALGDSTAVSMTVMRQAIEGNDQFLVTDTLTAEGQFVPESLVAHSVRAVICIPLRQRREAVGGGDLHAADHRLLGVLYLDNRFQQAQFTAIDYELISTIAREAAALVENAQLAVLEEQARQHKEELGIAAEIQQGLMAVQLPQMTFAAVQAQSIACKAVGGDFFDVVSQEDALSVALVDVSGKGISAAILASTLQGMLYVQLQAGRALREIAAATNDYLCHKDVGKYATMLLLRLHGDGRVEYMNCGHVQPRLCTGGQISQLTVASPPVGLLNTFTYEEGKATITAGSRLILVSDGFTEAEDAEGNFFGEERLEAVSLCGDIDGMLARMREFCRDHPANDDCTLMQITYLGPDGAIPPGDGAKVKQDRPAPVVRHETT